MYAEKILESKAQTIVPYDISILVVVCYINTVHQSFFPSVVLVSSHEPKLDAKVHPTPKMQICRSDSSKPRRVAKKGM